MKIAVCSIGSRGDIQPFLVFGHALACRGHEVKLATAEDGLTGYAVSYNRRHRRTGHLFLSEA